MAATLRSSLKRWREHYVPSLLLSGIAKPLWLVCHHTANLLQTKVAKNGVTFELPNGKKMTIGRDAGIALASLLFWHGLNGYEPSTSRALRFFFERSSTFIDVGANCGLYSILAGLWNPDIKVTSFEPFRPIFERLKKNVSLNRLDGRIVCENIALSSRSGNANLYVPSSEGADFETTGTLATNSWQVRKGSAAVQVDAMRFDDYECVHPMKIDLIKIDVEDFEADVLEGMSATVRRDRPFIICEILERNREHRNERTRRLIENWNYTPYWIAPSGYIRVSRFDFPRKDSQDFILSPVSSRDEIIDNPSVLFEARSSLGKHDLPGIGELETRTNGTTVACE
jgi:FkbM family methyltransferase